MDNFNCLAPNRIDWMILIMLLWIYRMLWIESSSNTLADERENAAHLLTCANGITVGSSPMLFWQSSDWNAHKHFQRNVPVGCWLHMRLAVCDEYVVYQSHGSRLNWSFRPNMRGRAISSGRCSVRIWNNVHFTVQKAPINLRYRQRASFICQQHINKLTAERTHSLACSFDLML